MRARCSNIRPARQPAPGYGTLAAAQVYLLSPPKTMPSAVLPSYRGGTATPPGSTSQHNTLSRSHARLLTGSEPVPMSRVQAGCSPGRATPGIEEVPAPTVGPAGPPDLHTYRPQPLWLRMPPLPRSNALSQITSRPTTDVTDAVSSCPDFCLLVRNPRSTAMCFWTGPEGRSLTSQTPSAPSAVNGKDKAKGLLSRP